MPTPFEVDPDSTAFRQMAWPPPYLFRILRPVRASIRFNGQRNA